MFKTKSLYRIDSLYLDYVKENGKLTVSYTPVAMAIAGINDVMKNHESVDWSVVDSRNEQYMIIEFRGYPKQLKRVSEELIKKHSELFSHFSIYELNTGRYF